MPTMQFAPAERTMRSEISAVAEGKCVKFRRQEPWFEWERPEGEIRAYQVEKGDLEEIVASGDTEVKFTFESMEALHRKIHGALDVLFDIEVGGVSITKIPGATVSFNRVNVSAFHAFPIVQSLPIFTEIQFHTPAEFEAGLNSEVAIAHGLVSAGDIRDGAVGFMDYRGRFASPIFVDDGCWDMSRVMASTIIEKGAADPGIFSSEWTENAETFDPPQIQPPVGNPLDDAPQEPIDYSGIVLY